MTSTGFKLVLIVEFEFEMSLISRWIIGTTSCLSLIQSIIWIGLGVGGALIYLDIITVKPYQKSEDFFLVTLAKLYFEGPKSKIEGSYLGKFSEDYRNLKVIDLFWPDKVFAVLIAYVIINIFYFYVSILLFVSRNSKKPKEYKRLSVIALEWSCITFLLCAIDIMFAYYLFRDFLQVQNYINKSECIFTNDVSSFTCKRISELPYIPLAMALISGRVIVLWVWNFVIACLFFFDALCCKKIMKECFQPEKDRVQEQKITMPPKPQQVLPPIKLINKSYSTSLDINKDKDSIDIKRSIEAITSFSDDCRKYKKSRMYFHSDRDYVPSENSFRSAATWNPQLNFKEWNVINEGFESDEDISIELEKNHTYNEKEEPGQKKIKVVKPLIGKPVSIPYPPPLPISKSCSC